MGYNYVNETIIKPYKETVDEINDTYNDIKDNNLIDKALMISANDKANTVTTETVMLAANDLSLI